MNCGTTTRSSKKNQPVRDLVIVEEEAKVVKKIYSLLSDEGYGTNRVANYLNEQGIKTKRGTTLWRSNSIRSLTFCGVLFLFTKKPERILCFTGFSATIYCGSDEFREVTVP